MNRKTRIAALALAVLAFVVMLFSASFIVAEADHACTGAQCPICQQISVCRNTLRLFALAVAAAAVAAGFTYICIGCAMLGCAVHTPATLITLKIKLSN